jgi:hypothetical protein
MTADFPSFSTAVANRVKSLSQHELYVVEGIDLFTSYLLSFPEGTDPMFRVRTTHDCSCCKNFVRNMGGVVAIVNGRKESVWSVPNLPEPYATVAAAMDALVQQLPIKSVFRTKETRFGASHTYDSDNRRWDHFHAEVATRHRCARPDEERGSINTTAQVLRRGLDTLGDDTFQTVLDLIDSNALYRGSEHRRAVQEFQTLQRAYRAAGDGSLHVWSNVGNPVARFRNTVIGTLIQDLSDGVDLERAVRGFEQKVAPTNYKRTTALITPAMVTKAVEKLRELDLERSIERRFARLEDVSVNDVLFVDNSVQARMRDGLTSLLMEAVGSAPPKNTSGVTNIPVVEFVSSVLAKARRVEVLLKNQHLGNFVSVTAPVHADAGKLFRWNNSFAWSYDGEVADSIKARVKRAGGNTNAALRVSLAWSNYDDLDIHADCPDGHIYFGNKLDILDVDMNAGGGRSREPVENLSWTRPRDGVYRIHVNQYNQRETADVGFTLEIECEGRVTQLSYPLGVKGTVDCITFKMVRGELTDLKIVNKSIRGGDVSTQKWGVATENFVPVSTLMCSPNHWEGAGAVGNQHWFLILEGCRNPDSTRGIYNEFLRSDLEPHRKVFEVLGNKTKCAPAEQQLSGVGFSQGRNDEVTVRVSTNNSTRAYNIIF